MRRVYTTGSVVHELSVGHLNDASLYLMNDLPDDLLVTDRFRDLGFRPTWRVLSPSTQEREHESLHLCHTQDGTGLGDRQHQ